MDDRGGREHRRESIEAPPGPLPKLIFPPNSHLLVTTKFAIYSKRASLIERIFWSPKGGIVSAKEPSDGSGLLAIADGYVVILCKKGDTPRRHRLKSVDGILGLLSFANNYQDLIFSTALQSSLRCFSIEHDRLCNFECTHPSPPTALAVSAASKYIVSASPSPPVVYLQDLTVPGRKVHFKPKQSNLPITVASFHPDQDEIFLLAYKDGTLSIHSASRIVLLRTAGSDGCLGHLKRAHRLTNTHTKRREHRSRANQSISNESITVGERSVGITAASFVSGYKLRTVSVAGDGKCRVVDFDKGANIIRSWSVQAACSSLAVYTYRDHEIPSNTDDLSKGLQPQSTTKPNPRLLRSSEPNYIVAIGRTDGALLIFDAAGLLRSIEYISHRYGPLIDLAWISESHTRPVEAVTHLENTPPSTVANIRWSFQKFPAPPQSAVNPRSPHMKPGPSLENLKDGSNAAGLDCANETCSGVEKEPGCPPTPETSKTHQWLGSSSQQLFSCPGKRRIVSSPETQRRGSKIDGLLQISSSAIETLEEQLRTPPAECLSENASVKGEIKDINHDSQTSETIIRRRRKGRNIDRMPGSWIEGSSSGDSTCGPGKFTGERNLTAHTGFGNKFRSKWPKSPTGKLRGAAEARRLRRASGLPTASTLARELPTDAQKKFESGTGAEADVEDLSMNGNDEEHPRSPSSMQVKLCGTICSKPGQDLRLSSTISQPIRTISQKSAPVGPAYSDPRSRSGGNTFESSWLLAQPPDPKKLSGLANSCNQTCAEVIREEMSLVRAEIATLRKGLWAFGSRIEMGASVSNMLKQWESSERAS